MTKTEKRRQWAMEHIKELQAAATPITDCPKNCRAQCNNGATCHISSGGGWGYWVKALSQTDIKQILRVKNYWSGSNPTPSTSINRGIADYITAHAPEDIR